MGKKTRNKLLIKISIIAGLIFLLTAVIMWGWGRYIRGDKISEALREIEIKKAAALLEIEEKEKEIKEAYAVHDKQIKGNALNAANEVYSLTDDECFARFIKLLRRARAYKASIDSNDVLSGDAGACSLCGGP